MAIASEEDTLHFINALWFQWGITLVRTIAQEYNLNEEQTEAITNLLLRPNDWIVEVNH